MGEVHLDTENLFRAFGWTPTRQDAELRAIQLYQYDPELRLSSADDVPAVAALARTAVAALVDWSHAWLGAHQARLVNAVSYGKKDPGVRVALGPLRGAGFRHVTVPFGADKAEDAIVETVSRSRWAAAPYVFGSADRRLVDAVHSHVAGSSEQCAVLVLRPDVYEAGRRAWFDGPAPHYPALRQYGEGHVALHLVTHDWVRRQSDGRHRRAGKPPAVEPTGGRSKDADQARREQRHERWFRRKFPKPSPRVPLSSEGWVLACRRGRIPPLVARWLRREVESLYGDGFETGDGPVGWVLACRAAVILDRVRHQLDAPPTDLTEIEQAAFSEARRRLVTLSRGSGDSGRVGGGALPEEKHREA